MSKLVDQSAQAHSGTIHVSGDVPIKLEYYENGGAALARLTWTRIGDGPAPLTPSPSPRREIAVIHSDPGFSKGGSPMA